jgi:alpha-mannosidase
VPVSLGETRLERSDEWTDLPITTRVSLSPGVRRVDVQTTVDNSAADHRLRVLFPVPVAVDTFDVEGHFDVVTRPLDLPADTEDWVEQPAATHPQCGWARVSDGTVGLMIANRGLPEIEAVRTERGTKLALTLLRSVGWLSRADLSVRRGHAGPGLPTPEAQCIGEHTFEYALIPLGGAWTGAADQAQAFGAPLRAVPTGAHGGALPSSASFVKIEPENLIVTALKEAEDGSGLIVRFWNTSETACEAVVKFLQKPVRVFLCTLGERILGSLEMDQTGHVHVPARGREIVTLLARF